MASLCLPCHEHPLITRELSPNCTVHCNRCAHTIIGPGQTRCCLECQVFFHEPYTKWPVQIQHPSHPQHQLDLVMDSHFTSNYCCHMCSYSARAEDLVATLPSVGEPAGDSETIEHFAHEHSLDSFSIIDPNNIRCKACNKEISSRVYGCRSCMWFLHEPCAQLPIEIPEPPLHSHHQLILISNPVNGFKCNGCCLSSHEFTYHCNECNFNLDVRCAVSTLHLKDQKDESTDPIHHFSHSHQLRPFTIGDDSNDIKCKACGLLLSGEVYSCLDCIFFLHKSCTELPQELVHSLHPDHSLVLRERSGQDDGRFRCSCCMKTSSDFVYTCGSAGKCNFHIDIVCALETLSALAAGATEELQHAAHGHLLTLRYLKGENVPLCNACKEPVHGLCYFCLSCKSFVLHHSCSHVRMDLKHAVHHEHPLTPLPRPPGKHYFYCNGCNRKSTGFAFYCAKCDFYLDIKCVTNQLTLKHQLHEHNLFYFERAAGLRCNACGKSCNTDLYRCVSCDFNLHCDCLPLPSEIRHDIYHAHGPLFLSDKYHDDRYDQDMCDACDNPRHPDHGVYLCEEDCRFAGHIQCLISMPIYEQYEAERNVKRSPENPQLDKLDKEIASLSEAMDRTASKLQTLMRQKAVNDFRFLNTEDGSFMEDSQIKKEATSDEWLLDELVQKAASLNRPIEELKREIERMKSELEALENEQQELMRKSKYMKDYTKF